MASIPQDDHYRYDQHLPAPPRQDATDAATATPDDGQRADTEVSTPRGSAPSPKAPSYEFGKSDSQKIPKDSKWHMELFSAVFSAACMLAMAIVLSRLNNTMLAAWPVFISPNAVIAILSTAAKASMMLPVAECISQLKWIHFHKGTRNPAHVQIFDTASRGPWGALRLFLMFWKATSPAVTAIGCIITITAIALDPFTQQILSYQPHSTRIPYIQSSVSRSQVYDLGGAGTSFDGVHALVSRDRRMQLAAISALYDMLPDPPSECPGVNCTYPDFTSIGVCNTCADVTAGTRQSCSNDPRNFPQTTCNFTFPNERVVTAYSSVSAHQGFRHSPLNVSGLGEQNFSSSLGYILRDYSIIRFSALDENTCASNCTLWNETLTAYQCSYELCAKAYSGWGSVNGTLYPGTTHTSALRPKSLNDSLQVLEVVEPDFPGDPIYRIRFFDTELIKDTLDTVFKPSKYGLGSFPDAPFMDALFTSPDTMGTIGKVATAMSYRMLDGPNATKEYGDVYAEQTFVYVRWEWLIPQLVLEFFTWSLLICVMWATSRARLRAWKSDLAPLLYNCPLEKS